MKRRRLLVFAAGSYGTWPALAQAQQAATHRTVGVLGAATPTATGPWMAAFVKRMSELGWTEGRNLTLQYRWAEGRNEPLPGLAAELVRLKVDVILTHATAPVVAAKQATSVIPIVFANAGDPVGNALVASLARPGGNVTGLSIQGTDTVGKRVELLREVAPRLRRLAILGNAGNAAVLSEMREVQAFARGLGLDADSFEIRRAEDIEPAFQAFFGRTDALYVGADPLAIVNRVRINTMALNARLPTMSSVRAYVEAGSLMSYGANFPDLWRRAADIVDKILRGANPADIPVEQPTKFDLIVNAATAKALGLTIPPTLLARADEVIE